MDDRALVAALVSGDPRGLEGAYRTYADRLYTYCRGMLRDADAAADAVHDTFLVASQRAGQLRDPERLRPWLYAIARNECLRLLRRRKRDVPLEEAGEVSAPPVDPAAGMRADEIQELVWAAAAGLNPGDREVFELAVRHELPAPEVSAALGVSVAHAHARLSRARAQLERALGALLVARTGRQECPELRQLLAGWDGRLTALTRKRVSRHLESCDVCEERRRRQLAPAALFSAYAGLPMLVAPAELWPRLQLTSADASYAQAVAARAGRLDPADGFPRPLDVQRHRAAVAGVAAVAVAALLAAAGGWAVAPPPTASTNEALPPTSKVVAPTSTPGSTAAPLVPSAVPASTVSPTPPPPAPPQPSPSPALSPTPSPSPSPAAMPLEIIKVSVSYCRDASDRLVLRVHATANRPVVEGWFILPEASAEPPHRLTVAGTQASADIPWDEQQPPPSPWRVTVAADDERASADGTDVGRCVE